MKRSIEKTSESLFSHEVPELDSLLEDLKPDVHESAINRNKENESVRYRKKKSSKYSVLEMIKGSLC